MFKMTDVVRHLLIINLIVFVFTELIFPNMIRVLALYYPTSPYFQPFQLVTHFFTHAGLGHIFFNMFGLVMFGSPVEALWGPRRFLLYYIICALGAAITQLLMMYFQIESTNGLMVGASGAIYGLLVAFGTKFPNAELMLIFLPIPIKAKYFIPGLIALDLFLGISNFSADPIAHFAHLGGAFFGFLLILLWTNKDSNFRLN